MTARKLTSSEVDLPVAESLTYGSGETFDLSSHRRARQALDLGLLDTDSGFNVFVLGEDQSGRMTSTLAFVREQVTTRPPPDDWLYLNNFQAPGRPLPVRLPAGSGCGFLTTMAALIPKLREALTSVFGSQEYESQVKTLAERPQAEIERMTQEVRTDARGAGMSLVQTPQGPQLFPMDDEGKPVEPDQLPEDRQEAFRRSGEAFVERMRDVGKRAARLQADLQRQVHGLNRRVAENAIYAILDSVQEELADHPALVAWLQAMREDILDNIPLFRGEVDAHVSPERRYAVNLLVDHADDEHPAVVLEANPTYEHLFGAIEYAHEGEALHTDFTMIRPGALHRANGGVLLLRAQDIAKSGAVWEFLKGALRDREIRIEELYRDGGAPVAGAPQPAPIPLEVTVILVGSPRWYYTFFSVDPEFRTYFKVKADIDADMDRTPENLACYAALIQKMAEAHDSVCEDDAVNLLLGIASRWAANREKLTSRFELIEDVLSEAVKLAPPGDSTRLPADIVSRTLVGRRHRNARVEDRMLESIARGTIMIDTSDSVIGQINGLVVRNLGDHEFGAPTRITARASVGRRGVINIERDTELGGPIQQKGVMVLQGFLAGHFARRIPLSFNCSITFEQSYSGVEGDSASLAELLVVLSDLSGVPLRQDLAITGSVNQRGETQPIGGAHHKVEGFFRTCLEGGGPGGGLSGTQGVLVPASNEPNLILRKEVVEAVDRGEFHIWSVETVEDAIAMFTGLDAGIPDENGAYSPDTVFGRVQAQLDEFDRVLIERERGIS